MTLTFRRSVTNIRQTFQEIPEAVVAENINWYEEAHAVARELADSTSIPLRAACHLIAALSPGIRWHQNVKDAWAVATVAAAGGDISKLNVSTYGPNKAKAWAIATKALRGEEFESILSGPKVSAFARNIEFPQEEKEVTIDFHAYSIAAGRRFTVSTVPDISPTRATTLKKAYAKVGREVGLKGHQMQAVTWVWWRRSKSWKK